MASITLQDLEQHYKDSSFSNTSPVSLENMSIYGDTYGDTVTPQNVNVPSGLQTINIAEVPEIDIAQVPETQQITQSNGLGYLLNQEGSQSRDYQPGGKYEHHPLMSGALNERLVDGEIVPNYNYGSSMGSIRPGYSEFSPLEMSYMSEMPQSGQDLSRMEKLNMMARNFKGVNSAYGDYRTTGKLGEYADKGIGTIPLVNKLITGIRNSLGLQPVGDRSDRSRWAVDNVGYGQGIGRDQWGVFTGGKTMMGTTADYKTRMENRIDEIKALQAKGLKNNSWTKQLKDYYIKIAILEGEEKKRRHDFDKIIKKREETQAAKAKIEAAEKAQKEQAAREAATAARAMAKNPQVYRDAGITSGGFASQNTGTNPNFSNRTGRGRTGYGKGGIVTL